MTIVLNVPYRRAEPRWITTHLTSPDLPKQMLNAIMDALAAHGTMSKQALDSPKLRSEMQDVLLGPGQLYEALRERGAGEVGEGG